MVTLLAKKLNKVFVLLVIRLFLTIPPVKMTHDLGLDINSKLGDVFD